MRTLTLALWGLVLLLSGLTGRLDLLLRQGFHALVILCGAFLLVWAGVQLVQGGAQRRSMTWPLALSAAVAILILVVPPNPSFNDLVANRAAGTLEEPSFSVQLPPAQRTLTDWVRLLSREPDPLLHDGSPVRISGFVMVPPGDRAHVARLLVRCCLADAVPVGLPVRWPDGRVPQADTWVSIDGRMAVERHNGLSRSVVVAERVRGMARPSRPLEP